MMSSPDPAAHPVSNSVAGFGGPGSNRTVVEESWFAARIASGKVHPAPPRAAPWTSTWIVVLPRTGLTAHVPRTSRVAAATMAERRGWRWRMEGSSYGRSSPVSSKWCPPAVAFASVERPTWPTRTTDVRPTSSRWRGTMRPHARDVPALAHPCPRPDQAFGDFMAVDAIDFDVATGESFGSWGPMAPARPRPCG